MEAMERPHRFSRLNLNADNITSLRVAATFSYTHDRADASERFPTLDLPPFPLLMSTVSYRPRGGVRHAANLVVTAPPLSPANETIQVLLSYTTDTTEAEKEKPERNAHHRRESDLWAVVLDLGIPDDLTGNVEFNFPGHGGVDLWFPLPVSLAGSKEPEDVFEIRSVSGVKLSKTEPDDPGYRFTLSCPFGKDVSLRMSFDLEGMLHPSIVRTIQRRAVRLVPDLAPTV